MIDTAELAFLSGLDSESLQFWHWALSEGMGFDRVLIPQKRRPPRRVIQPWRELDRVLKQLRSGLEATTEYAAPDAVHGFVAGRSIATNASRHLDRDVVLRVDLVDFFGAIDAARLTAVLESSGLDPDCASLVAGLTTVDGSLAQGFSTSPFLSNLAFLESDHVLTALADEAGACYTRYVDDLVFSGPQDTIDDEFMSRIKHLLNNLGWTVNPRKTRFMRRGRPQFVTGLYVGDPAGPHVPRSMKRLLRREVYFASQFGISNARANSPTPMGIDRLSGWLHYAAHVDPVFGVPLREKWRLIAPSASDPFWWDVLLDEIDFPKNW